jgi:regulator of sirC expression with transglutaminase-like and TPR domain
MFQENGFHGSHEDMNNRANSYLNEVMDDREGLPITLCLLHREFARRLGLDVTPRNFQGRCMNHLTLPGKPAREVYIDAFDRGKILTAAEASSLLLNLNDELPADETWKPVSNKDVILRMLNNLTANAVAARDDARILRYMDVFLTIAPDSVQQHLQRLLILAKTGQNDKARADAKWLIAKDPPGIDIERVQDLMETLK